MSELKVYHCNEWHNEYTGFYLKDESDKVIANNKYKRCLAMARWCEDRWADIATPYFKSVWYYEWQKRWMKLAKQFKEAK